MNDWWEQLETRLERELANFLTANPAQQALLQEQEARDRQARGGLAGNGLQIVLPWPLPIYRHYSQGGLV